MLSSSDLPACPACGSREVRAVHKYKNAGREIIATFYACAQCGSDRTQAWTDVQPPKPSQKISERKPPHRLGIGATVKPGDSS